MNHPKVLSEPEAIFAITKYNLLKQLGSGYTWSSLDEESYENIELMSTCMHNEAKALENSSKKAQFYGDVDVER